MFFSSRYWLIVPGILIFLCSTANADEVFAHSKSLNMSFTAIGYPWCKSHVNMQISAKDNDKYESTQFYTILKKLTYVLAQKCPKANSISLQSTSADGSSIWLGRAEKSDDWKIHRVRTDKPKEKNIISEQSEKKPDVKPVMPQLNNISATVKQKQSIRSQQTPEPRINKPAISIDGFSTDALNYESELMAIYLGDFEHSRLERNSIAVSSIFSKYLQVYGQLCSAYLPKNKVPITQTKCATEQVTTNGYGMETDRVCVKWVKIPTGLYADPVLYKSSVEASANTERKITRNMFSGNPYSNLALVDDVLSIGTDMENLIKKNHCGSDQLKRFESNLYRFVENEAPLLLPGKPNLASIIQTDSTKFKARELNLNKLLDDLIIENSRGWMMNRYQQGSISNVSVEPDSNSPPQSVKANYSYTGLGGVLNGYVVLSFKQNVPKCLYFYDAPNTCRSPSRKVINKYERGGYLKSKY